MVFGVLEIILGAFCVLLLPVTIFGQVMVANQNGSKFDFSLAVPSLLTFTVLAAGLIWLGIGSIQARRWARALLLCLGWMGLCGGLVAMAAIIPILGSMEEMMRQQGREMPPGALAIAKFFMIAIVSVIYILIPGSLVLFYRRPNVKLTCESRDPKERWTDRCPLPVLAMCILQLFGGIYVLLMPRFGAAVPLAGFLVTGWPARILWFGFAGFSLYAARGFYRLQRRVWSIYTVAIIAMGLSSMITFIRIDLLDYDRAIGLPDWQIKQIAASPIIHGHMIIWMSALSVILFGGYLLYLRRYFAPGKTQSVAV
jgi:hypothetical protein